MVRLGLYFAISYFVITIIRYVAIYMIVSDGQIMKILNEIANYLIVSIVIILVAVPESLSVAVTIALSFSL